MIDPHMRTSPFPFHNRRTWNPFSNPTVPALVEDVVAGKDVVGEDAAGEDMSHRKQS
jgi:hypothetical protein